MALETLLLMSALAFNSANSQAPTPYSQQQKPVAYPLQSQEDIIKRLIAEAELKAKSNPVSAIPLYERVIDEGPGSVKEEAIGKLMGIHNVLVQKAKYENRNYESVVRKALNFYNKIIKNHDSSPHLARVYLDSGKLLWQSQAQLDFQDYENRLNRAFELGDNNTKAEAAWQLGLAYLSLSNSLPDNLANLPKITAFDCSLISKKYLTEVIRLAPDSVSAQSARNLLGGNELNPK